jgi:membrane carboxypeptidase/penicillin-binding protein PbpC
LRACLKRQPDSIRGVTRIWRFGNTPDSVERLARLGLLTPEQQMNLSPPIARRFDPPRFAPHFVDAFQSLHPGLRGRVVTTLDLDMQTTAERELRIHLDALNRNDVTEAALVILDNATGAVRAMAGSSDYETGQINGTMRPRSCGSTLKPPDCCRRGSATGKRPSFS